MDTIKLDNKNVRMIAHRGLSGLEKENTCSAFVAAGNRHTYAGIETDVHRTSDGQYIIFHDDDTARVAKDSMIIENTTYETLRNLRLLDVDGERGRADLRMPNLDEYILLCKKYEKTAVLELKNQFAAADVYKIAARIDKLGWLEHIIFISFQLKNLVYLRRRYPDVPAQYLLKETDDTTIETLRKHNIGLDVRYTAVTPELVQAVHAIGQEINCWTCNTEEEGRALVEMGVDYITTNILEGTNAAR